MSKNKKILIVEDDADIRGVLRVLLGKSYTLTEAENGKEGIRLFYEEHPDLVLLDVSMPLMDGWEVLARIRDMAKTPVIMLTARSEELEKVRGLKAGADDYLAKPFGKQELLARIEAVLRRSASQEEVPEVYGDSIIQIDFRSATVTVGGVEISLTPTEFRLLATLLRHPRQVLSARQLLELVWGDGPARGNDQVKLYVGYLRRKLGTYGELIETVRGFGYRYNPPAS